MANTSTTHELNNPSHNTRGKTAISGKTSTPNATTTPNIPATKTKDGNNWHQVLFAQNKEILRKLTDVEKAVQFLSDKYDELKIMYDTVVSENISLKNENTKIIDKLDVIEQNNNDLVNTINDIKQNDIKTTYSDIWSSTTKRFS